MAKGKVGLGRRGETLAATALARHGFRIVTRNWYCAEGEVDLIALRGGEWYFVEVRTRRGARYGGPEASIDARKWARMDKVARHYVGENVDALDVTWHLSVVAVVMDRRGNVQRITFYPDRDSGPWEIGD